MSKNKIITTLIICAVITSALAGYLIYHFMSPQRGTIFVFNSSYPLGTQIKENMLIPIQVDANIIVAGRRDLISSRFVTPAEYNDVVKSGDSLRMDVSEGMPLTTAMLSVQGGSKVEMNMKSDAIAITVPVDRFTGVTNNLKEGARVNVYSVKDQVTVLLQQNKRVLEVFKNNDGSLSGVSLEESITESMELVSAVSSGKIYLGLINATGYTPVKGDVPFYVADYKKYLDMESSLFENTEEDYTAFLGEDSNDNSENSYDDKQDETETKDETEQETVKNQDDNEDSRVSDADTVFTP